MNIDEFVTAAHETIAAYAEVTKQRKLEDPENFALEDRSLEWWFHDVAAYLVFLEITGDMDPAEVKELLK